MHNIMCAVSQKLSNQVLRAEPSFPQIFPSPPLTLIANVYLHIAGNITGTTTDHGETATTNRRMSTTTHTHTQSSAYAAVSAGESAAEQNVAKGRTIHWLHCSVRRQPSRDCNATKSGRQDIVQKRMEAGTQVRKTGMAKCIKRTHIPLAVLLSPPPMVAELQHKKEWHARHCSTAHGGRQAGLRNREGKTQQKDALCTGTRKSGSQDTV